MNCKSILSVFLIFILTFGMCSTAFAVDDVPDGYTPIYTAEDLYNIRNNLSGKYILMNDIDLSDSSEWKVIGDYGLPFTGELNGNGFLIIGLNTKRSLLGWVENAIIKDLGIFNCNIFQPEETASSSSSAGAFADNATNSSFEKCFATGSINVCVSVGWMTLASYCSTGGLVGISKNSTFVNCYNHANIHFTYDKISSAEIGGLVGDSYNTNFSSCYSTGKVSSENINKFELESSNIHKGGLAGSADNTTVFNYCYYENDLNFAIGNEQSTPNGTKSLSDAEMKNQNSFAGFDFDNVWKMEENGYPKLKNNKVDINNKISLKYKGTQPVSENQNVEIISWESSDDKVAIINDDGDIEAVGVGSATISVETSDGQSGNIVVSVSYAFWQKIIVYLFFGWLWY